MIFTSDEYKEYLTYVQENSYPQKKQMPFVGDSKIHNIDITTRVIDSPEFLSVQKDHKSENIYFSIKRYVDYIDLSETVCLIQYRTPGGSLGIYPVPFYDLTTFNTPGDERILFSWLVDGLATSETGSVEYAMRFYRVDEGDKGKQIVYNFNTLPTSSKVLYGLDVQDPDLPGSENFVLPASILDSVEDILKQIREQDIYWIEFK